MRMVGSEIRTMAGRTKFEESYNLPNKVKGNGGRTHRGGPATNHNHCAKTQFQNRTQISKISLIFTQFLGAGSIGTPKFSGTSLQVW